MKSLEHPFQYCPRATFIEIGKSTEDSFASGEAEIAKLQVSVGFGFGGRRGNRSRSLHWRSPARVNPSTIAITTKKKGIYFLNISEFRPAELVVSLRRNGILSKEVSTGCVPKHIVSSKLPKSKENFHSTEWNLVAVFLLFQWTGARRKRDISFSSQLCRGGGGTPSVTMIQTKQSPMLFSMRVTF